jgi:hypothetical protein
MVLLTVAMARKVRNYSPIAVNVTRAHRQIFE